MSGSDFRNSETINSHDDHHTTLVQYRNQPGDTEIPNSQSLPTYPVSAKRKSAIFSSTGAENNQDSFGIYKSSNRAEELNYDSYQDDHKARRLLLTQAHNCNQVYDHMNHDNSSASSNQQQPKFAQTLDNSQMYYNDDDQNTTSHKEAGMIAKS